MTSSQRAWTLDSLVAVAVWLVGSLVVFRLPQLFERDPASIPGHALALAGLGVVIGVALTGGWLMRHRLDVVCAGVVGLVATWLVFIQRAALLGTPHNFGLLAGDSGRLAAMATYSSQSWASRDVFNVGAPSQYPPLYPWLVGRLADLTGRDAWRLMAPVSVVMLAGSLLVSFALWRRMTTGPVAALISVAVFVGYTSTSKSYVMLAVAIFIPLVLLVLADSGPGRLHWLTAGILTGALVLLYYGPIVLASPSLVALVVVHLRDSATRRARLVHLAKIGATAFVVASWYVIPMLWATLAQGSGGVGDTFESAGLIDPLPPFRGLSPLTVSQAVGLIGAVAIGRRRWWATAMVSFIAGLFVFWGLAQVNYAFTGRTTLLHYVPRVLGPLLAAAGVLAAAELWKSIVAAPVARRTLAAGAAVAAVWLLAPIGSLVMPSLDWSRPNDASLAHLAPTPDGNVSRFAPSIETSPGFPLDAISSLVRDGVAPTVLSAEQSLHVYLPWPSYLFFDSTLSAANERESEIVRLATTTDPTEFAVASANLRHGPIDVFVLRELDGRWWWREIEFVPQQFASDQFVVTPGVGNALIIAVRTSIASATA